MRTDAPELVTGGNCPLGPLDPPAREALGFRFTRKTAIIPIKGDAAFLAFSHQQDGVYWGNGLAGLPVENRAPCEAMRHLPTPMDHIQRGFDTAELVENLEHDII